LSNQKTAETLKVCPRYVAAFNELIALAPELKLYLLLQVITQHSIQKTPSKIICCPVTCVVVGFY